MLQSSKLLSVFKPDTLSGVLTLFNDHNLSHYQTSSEEVCGALNLDVQDVYANGCTVNGTVHLADLGNSTGPAI